MTDESAIPTVSGTVDQDGRLIAAGPRLRALNRQAGSDDGGQLAIPQIAALARLAQTLGIMVSRTLVAADGDVDRDLTVRAYPEGNVVQLTIDGWVERQAATIMPEIAAERARYYADLEIDGRWECDEALRIVAVSKALAALANLSDQAIIGLPFTRLIRLIEGDGGDLPLLTGLAARSDFAGQMAELREAPAVRLRLHGRANFDPQGQLTGYSGGYALINRTFVARRAPPQSSRGDADTFAQRIDGALRQPIARIISSADEISARSNGPVRQDYAIYASDISAAGRHLLGLIDDISDLQTVESADFRAAIETIDLADIARRAAGLLGIRAIDRAVRIDAPSLGETLAAKGEFRRVLQIIVNLVNNAVRYSPSGASVWIRTEIEGDLAAVIVADQGKGIAAADHARIFDKFERLDPNEPGGSGLGLYISRQLARAMGGDITVDSAPGQGSRFVLTLPVG